MEKSEATGERIGGYRVVRRLATGGTSDVLLAKAEGPHGFERTVVLKLRYANFRTITRSQTREPPTRSADEIAGRAVELLAKTDAGRVPVRLLGVSVHGLGKPSDQTPATPSDELDFSKE